MYGWYRTKSYEIDGHRVWPLYGLFGTDGGVWYPGPTYWMEVPPSPTGRQTCTQFEHAEFHDKRQRKAMQAMALATSVNLSTAQFSHLAAESPKAGSDGASTRP